MKRILILSILLITQISLIIAQNSGKISGVITDADSKEPLVGCNVIIIGTNYGASTDPDGAFFILNVPPGKYDLQASIVGYEKTIQRGIVVNSARTTEINFNLRASAIEQEGVIIEATRPDVEKEKTSTSAIFRAEDVKQIAGMRDVSNVIGLAADVTDGHFRGGRVGEELYTLQGMGIVNPLDNTTGLLPIMSAVEEVEVITSGFGAQYGNAQSGVVNITMKEGKADKWRTHADFNSKIPARRYFGGNVFDLERNAYLQTMSDNSSWYSPSAEDPGYGYWTSMGSTLTARFGRDTAVQIAVAREMWKQSRHLLNNFTSDKNIDYSQELSSGGPINDDLRMFFALRNHVTWPDLPTEHPDVNRQIMGNIVADISAGAVLRVSGAYGINNTNEFPGLNSPTTPGYFRWLWDNLMSIQFRNNINTQVGIRFSHTLNPKTFYEIKLNSLITRSKRGSSPFPFFIPDSMLGRIDWSKIMAQPVTAPDGFSVGSGQDDFTDSKTQTYSLDASFTSQINKSHMINAGVQSNLYVITANDHRNMTSTIPNYNNYTARPREASLYLQDKMEFEGMIANVGLRWDMWDQNVKYNPNIYAPFRMYDTTLNQYIYSKDAMNKKTPVIGRLQPRLGMSFPVSVNTVFHLNYGSFMQRPSFQYILTSQIQPVAGINPMKAITLGNPALKPQTTNSYDVGIMQGFGEGFTLDVSGYYKDVKNLIQAATFTDSLGKNGYTSYINRAYADIRGFRAVLAKRKGNLSGSLNYQYSVATGKSSAVGSMMPSFSPDRPAELKNTSLKDILLDFDRTHNILINLAYATNEEWGMKIGGFYPLGDLSISLHSTIRSGRPYSYYNDIGIIEVANKRSPMEYNTNIQVSKKIKDFFGLDATLYLEIFNLFNDQILNYEYIFQSDISGQINPNITSYLSNNLRYQNDKHAREPQLDLDKSFLLYSNQPRLFNVGIAIDF
ncbi:MAG: TonB-dependent receptor [Ignavibacteriales bacterium]|nr:TonB-dependent receptor [Ignavibacteriales bacterium]